jgi:hypothetical protein
MNHRMRVEFEMLTADSSLVDATVRAKFISVTDVVKWRLVNDAGKTVYSGLVVSGPKTIPGGTFQMTADFTLDMPTDPTQGIPMEAIPAIQNAVITEFQKRAVIKTYTPPTTKQ